MLKITVKGEPNEIAAFFAHMEEADGLQVEYHSAISKRAATHKWGSAIAGIHAALLEGFEADVSIWNREKKRGQAQKGYVYLLPAYGAEGILGYKIGKTIKPQSRKSTFGVKLGFRVKFLALISTDDHSALETELHRLYATQRQGHSEFFALRSVDVDDIIRLMSPEDKKLLKEVNYE
jgi:hypothetical protein